MAIFVPIAYILGISGYPGNLQNVVANLTGRHTTYNVTIWFLLPYVITIIFARQMFVGLDQQPVIMAIGCLGLYIVANLISWMAHHHIIEMNYAVYELLRIVIMFPTFILGACLCKYNIVGKSKVLFRSRQYEAFLAWVLLILIRLSTDFDLIVQLVYATGLIILVCSIRKPNWVVQLFTFFGKHSTTIWLIHAYFIWYLFGQYPYSLKYPILIYSVSLLESTIIACIIDYAITKLTPRWLKNK